MTAETKHRYSTYALLIIFAIIFIVAVGLSFDVGERSHRCTENQSLKVTNGIWSCYTEPSIAYAEGYFLSNNTNPAIISISSTNVFYNITNITQGHYYNFEWSGYGIDVLESGLYRFSGSLTFTGGNGGDYDFVMTSNKIPISNCGMGTTAQTSIKNSVSFTCFTVLAAGAHLNFQVKDLNTPAQNINIYKMNINIEKMI